MGRGISVELSEPLGLCDPGKNKMEEGDIEVDIYFYRLRVGSPLAFRYRDPGVSGERRQQLSKRGTVGYPPNLSLGFQPAQVLHCPESVVLGFQFVQ